MITKFASAQVIEAKMAQKDGGLIKDAHRHTFDYDPRPGYLYVRSRAISSRINDNYDEFPADEIKSAYMSFVGKPVFVNHHNENHRRARGVIVDAALHEDRIPKTGEMDTWVEVLMEVDAVRFPKLAQAILAGEIDRTSMGCDVKASQCSACGNWAETPLQYCSHIPSQKGLKVRRKLASGVQEDVLVYEKCVGLSFFENSLLVEEPADPTAYFLGVDDRGLAMTASRKQSGIYDEAGQKVKVTKPKRDLPVGTEGTIVSGPGSSGIYKVDFGGGNVQALATDEIQKVGVGEVHVPPQVDTLRDDDCPVCGEHDSFDGDVCMVCQYKRPPEEFLDPDLEMAKEVDLRQDEQADAGGLDVDPETGQPNLEAGEEGLEPGLDENGLPIEGEEELLGEDELGEVEEEVDNLIPDEPGDEELNPELETGDEELNPELDPEANEDVAEEVTEDLAEEVEESSEEAVEEVVDEATGEVVEEVAEETEEELGVEGENPLDVNTDPGSIVADEDADEDFSAEFTVQEGQSPTQGVNSEDDSEDKDDFKKKKSRKSGDIAMRPTLEILAKQQGQLNALTAVVVEIARAAGIEKRPAVAKLVRFAEDDNPAQPDGWATEGEGTEAPVATSDEALGDVDNEAPAGGGPAGSESETPAPDSSPGTSEAKKRAQRRRALQAQRKAELEDVEEIGSTDEDDTEPDTKTDLEGGVGTVLDEPLDLNEVDVTAPVAGTEDLDEGARGEAGSGRTETEVRVDQEQANNPQPAFEETGWTEANKGEGRTIAAMRLARLRIAAGLEKGDDDLTLATQIAKSAMSNKEIQQAITLLSEVGAATAKTSARRPRGLVPRSAQGVERTVPSFSAPTPQLAYAVSADEFLFE